MSGSGGKETCLLVKSLFFIIILRRLLESGILTYVTIKRDRKVVSGMDCVNGLEVYDIKDKKVLSARYVLKPFFILIR